MNGPIVRVLAPNPGVFTLEGTNTWIVGRQPSIVIDPGPNDPAHLAEVRRSAGWVAAVLLTHDHEDHAEGAAAFAGSARAPLLAWRAPGGAERLRDGQELRAGGDLVLTAIHSPGHSSDSVVFHIEARGALFTGDSVLGRGTSFIDPPEGDLVQYLRSLQRMLDLRPRTIYPGHGPVVFDAAAKLKEYLDHRREREHQVLEALASSELGKGPHAPEELVPRIYRDYPEQVFPLAARSVLAHLVKLEKEGKVEQVGRRSSPRFALAAPRACKRCGRPVRGRAALCDRCSLAALQE